MKSPKRLGGYWYSNWTPQPNHPWGPPWTLPWFILAADPGREPLIKAGVSGGYDESQQAVIDHNMRDLIAGGFDYVAINWYHDGAAKKTVGTWALDGILASTVTGLDFAVAFDSETVPVPILSLANLVGIYDYWFELFQSPKYMRVKGRPVVFIDKIDNFYETALQSTGLTPTQAIALARERTGENIYFIACGNALPYWIGNAKITGADAYCVYNLGPVWQNRYTNAPTPGPNPTSFAELSANYLAESAWMLDCCRSNSLEFWVPSTSGFNNVPWAGTKNFGIPTLAEFDAHLQQQFTLMDSSDICRGLAHYAVNEWGEGGWMLPDKINGRGRLNIFRNHVNARISA